MHIYYSHYEIEGTDYKSRPSWFDYEHCFRNLLKTIEKRADITLHVVMDGKIENNFVSKYTDKFISHKIRGGNMRAAGLEMFKLAVEDASIPDDELIYFLENDYLHVEGWVDKVRELFMTYEGVEYISLYDHADKYFAYPDLVSKIYATNSCHWRTTPSTCGSFIMRKKLFLEDYQDFIDIEGDHNKWLALNEMKGRFILSPIPGLSTHCMDRLLSPCINWEYIHNHII